MINTVIFLYFLILSATLYLSVKQFSYITIVPLTIIYMLLEVPFLLTAYHNPETLYQSALAWVRDFDFVFMQHIFVRLIFLICLIATSYLYRAKNINNKVERPRIKKAHLAIVLFLLLFSYLSFLNQVGGLALLLMNMSNKSELIKGSAFFRLTFVYSTFLFSCLYICYISQRKNYSRIIFISWIVLLFLMLASYGERKNAVVLLVVIALSWHIMINPIKLLSGKVIASSLFVVFFAALAPPLREAGAFERYSLEPAQLVIDMTPHLGELFRRFSDIDISIFIFSYFENFDDFWYLSTLKNFFIGFFPSSFYPDKPPLDEGVIIYNLANGQAPPLGASFGKYIPVGWPLSRYTTGWVNFGYIGVILYSALTSLLLILLNNLTFKKTSIYMIPLYVTAVVSGVSISNASIFNFFIACFVISMSFFLITAYNIATRKLSFVNRVSLGAK